jgi:hypothetical protein
MAQDKKAINNKGKINQMKAKSVKKKEKATTKDVAGKRLRTKNTNSTAGRAVYSNPSPYANERRGNDRVAKPIGGQPARIRSRSGEAARNNVYPQRGPYVNHSSKGTTAGKSGRFKPGPRSRSTSAESKRSNVYPQKGPYVNRSSRQTEKPATRSNTRSGRLSTNARITKSYTRTPRSASQSAETSKGRRFGQGGAYVNQSSRSTENVASGSNRYSRKGKLSAGPKPTTRKKTTVTPRSASQPFVTKKKKDVYWGKFSKGEKAITTDISGNPLRRRNYRTPPNEIIKPKDPYAGRKRSSGDRAYSGTFRSGHESATRRGEKAWLGDVSGQPIRKRPSRQTEVAGVRSGKTGGGSISASPKYRSNRPLNDRSSGSLSLSDKASGRYRSNRPLKGSAGSVSASGRFRSNKPLEGSQGALSISGQMKRDNTFRPKGGGSISASGKYRSNQPFRGGTGSISASAKYRSNKPLNSRAGSLSISGKNRVYEFNPKGGGSISASATYRSNKPLKGVAGSISASGNYRSNKPFRNRMGSLSVSGENRVYDYKPKGGGSISASAKYRSNKPLREVAGSISGSPDYRSNKPLNRIAGSISASASYRSNKPVFRGKKLSMSDEVRTYDHKPKGIRSASGKLWNNNEKPIEVRTPKGARADEVIGLQVAIKSKETGIKPKAVKGSMPGLPPTKSSVKASEYYRSMTVSWSYERNPNSAAKSLKTIGPSNNFISAAGYSGKTRLTKNYRHNPMSHKDALKVIAPGRAYARITDYQGNIKMAKYKDKRFLPDSKFAHNKQNNVKHERTIMTDFKLIWTKVFKKNGTQPDAVKEKSVRPRYDKRERELWPGLYD